MRLPIQTSKHDGLLPHDEITLYVLVVKSLKGSYRCTQFETEEDLQKAFNETMHRLLGREYRIEAYRLECYAECLDSTTLAVG